MADGFSLLRGFVPLLDGHDFVKGPVLCVAPHPDDEIIGCGGALAFHSSRGDAVTVVTMTSGEAGDPREFEAGSLRETRLRESKEASRILGLREVLSLGYPDGGLETGEIVVDRLLHEIHRVCPRIVYAPSPLECHPDHLATSWVAAAALLRSALICRLFLYEVNHPTLASFLLDITGFIEKKRAALSCFKSQQRYQDIVGKCLASAYARTVNVDLPSVDYAEAFLEIEPARLPEIWGDLSELFRKLRLSTS